MRSTERKLPDDPGNQPVRLAEATTFLLASPDTVFEYRPEPRGADIERPARSAIPLKPLRAAGPRRLVRLGVAGRRGAGRPIFSPPLTRHPPVAPAPPAPRLP